MFMVSLMLSLKWVVPNVLAVSPMPSKEDLKFIASTFRCVVVLAEKDELLYDINELRRMGPRVFRRSIPDFSAPNLVKLHRIVELVDYCEKPVLVHCTGGRGRSGTVAVAYLMLSKGMRYGEALAMARSVDPGFVESETQHRVLKLYDRLLSVVPRRLLSKAIEIGKKYDFGRGVEHAAKVLELSIELVKELEREGAIKLSTDVEKAPYIAATLHDIGVHHDPSDRHREYSYRMILKHGEELNNACNCSVAGNSAVIARLHGRKDPVPENLDKELKIAIGIIRIADGFDYTLTQSVERIEVARSSRGIEIKAHCIDDENLCEINIDRANTKKTLLEKVLDTEISIEMSNEENY